MPRKRGNATTAISPPEPRRAALHFPQPPGQGSVAALLSCRRSYSVQEPAPISHWKGLASLHPEEGCLLSLLLHMATCLRSLFFFHSLCPKSPLSGLSIFSKFYPGELNSITRALKSRVLSLAGVRIDVPEGEVREIQSMRGILPPLLERATWKARGEMWVASRSKDGLPRWQPGRKRTSVLPPRGSESGRELEWAWKQIPGGLPKGVRPYRHLDLTSWNPSEPHWPTEVGGLNSLDGFQICNTIVLTTVIIVYITMCCFNVLIHGNLLWQQQKSNTAFSAPVQMP